MAKGEDNFPAFLKVAYSLLVTEKSKTAAKYSEKSKNWLPHSRGIETNYGYFYFP